MLHTLRQTYHQVPWALSPKSIQTGPLFPTLVHAIFSPGSYIYLTWSLTCTFTGSPACSPSLFFLKPPGGALKDVNQTMPCLCLKLGLPSSLNVNPTTRARGLQTLLRQALTGSFPNFSIHVLIFKNKIKQNKRQTTTTTSRRPSVH